MIHEMTRRIGVAALAAVAAATMMIQPAAVDAQVAVRSKPAIFHDGTWYLRSSMTSGVATSTFRYGISTDIPVMGDWDGDGDDTVGVVRATEGSNGIVRYVWYLRNSNSGGSATVTPFTYGRQEFLSSGELRTIPVVGDWDGDGDDTIGVMIYEADALGHTQWHLRNSNTGGSANSVITYGSTTIPPPSFENWRDRPVVGDWDGDGDDTIGLVRHSACPKCDTWLLRNSNTSGNADITFTYGSGSYTELPVVGDWDGNGTYTPALLRNNPPTDDMGGFEVWLFRNSNSSGPASGQITFGSDAQTVDQFDFVPRFSWK